MDVTVYSTSRCSACKTTKEQLDRLLNGKFNYVVDDIEVMNDLNIRKVPTTVLSLDGVEVTRFQGVQPDSVYLEALASDT